jgi:hypothetical protein
MQENVELFREAKWSITGQSSGAMIMITVRKTVSPMQRCLECMHAWDGVAAMQAVS